VCSVGCVGCLGVGGRWGVVSIVVGVGLSFGSVVVGVVAIVVNGEMVVGFTLGVLGVFAIAM
jgi:hypothetical protein